MLQRVHEAKGHASRNEDLCDGCVLGHKEICQTHQAGHAVESEAYRQPSLVAAEADCALA